MLDNRSCLFDPEGEKDPTAWQPAQEWLLSLRRQGKAVLLIHHSNRQGSARGHSKAEDPLNLMIKLSRPEGYSAEQGARVVVEFEKYRGIHGGAVAPFVAHLRPEGWHVESLTPEGSPVRDKLLEYVALAEEVGDRPKSANAAIRGARVQKALGLKAWAELLKAGDVEQHPDGGFCVRKEEEECDGESPTF